MCVWYILNCFLCDTHMTTTFTFIMLVNVHKTLIWIKLSIVIIKITERDLFNARIIMFYWPITLKTFGYGNQVVRYCKVQEGTRVIHIYFELWLWPLFTQTLIIKWQDKAYFEFWSWYIKCLLCFFHSDCDCQGFIIKTLELRVLAYTLKEVSLRTSYMMPLIRALLYSLSELKQYSEIIKFLLVK